MRRVLSILLLLCASAPLAAQVRESLTVEVIEVPVYVTDGQGKPIRNLPRDAFGLRVNGKPQPIEFFDTVDVTAAPAAGQQRPPRERRLYLLLFDLAYNTEAEILHAQRAAEALIEGDTNDADLFAVAKYVPREGIQFISAFLSSRPELRRAIYTLKPSEAHDPLQVAIVPSERVAWITEMGMESVSPRGNGMAALASAERASALRGGPAFQASKAQPHVRLTEDEVNSLVAMVANLNAMEGQKHVVFFSEGARATPSRIYLRDISTAFRQAGVFLHAVGTASGNRETLRMITAETDGQWFWGSDPSRALQQLTTSQEVAYLLAFHRRDRSPGTIDVRVNGLPRGATVRFRTGYGEASAKKNINQLVLADIITNDLDQNGVALDGFVKPAKGGAELSVGFPREQLVPLLDTADPSIELYLYVMNPKGETVQFGSKHVVFDEESRKGEGRIGLKQWFDLPPGKYVAKALMTIHGSTAMGFTRGEFTVEE